MRYEEHAPTWRVAETLRREARDAIDGRANFEKHFGRPSAKPLTPVEVDPRYLIQLLDALDEAERRKEEYHEQWMIAAGNRPDEDKDKE